MGERLRDAGLIAGLVSGGLGGGPARFIHPQGDHYGVLGLVVLILDIIAIVSVLGGTASAGHKILWTLLILLLPFVGMILYFLVGQSPADA